ncbi:MAG: lysine-sensitive aspartokinase 3 [Bacteriovoracaceae bacterium]|nr:lysine-sensitive aspartokinase 3 [Bacteriovoracaceae bacterium]
MSGKKNQKFHVLKFGGTSMKTPTAIKQVASIVENDEESKVVVVSAVGGITDKLLALQNRYENIFDQHKLKEIIEIHQAIATSLELPLSVHQFIESEVKSLTKFDHKTFSQKEVDELISLGERLSAYLLYSFMKQSRPNKEIEWLDAREVIVTDDQFGKAIPLIEEIEERAKNKINLNGKKIYITQGFIGSTKHGLTTTLGRGGSDYSAALFAEAINAKHLFIYTDVPGVYSMDPNVVTSALPIATLSFQEMAEMANFGAKILHPATLAPCLRLKIPVTILSTFAPELGGTLVKIDEEGETDNNLRATNTTPLVRAITLRKNQILVTIKSLNMLNAYGFLANIFSILAKFKISVDLITTSEVSVALTIDGTSVGSSGVNPFTNPELISELQKFSDVTIEDKLTLIAVVGPSLTGPGIAQQIFAKLENTQVRAICYGASSSSIGILVHANEAATVATLMHKKLIEGY